MRGNTPATDGSGTPDTSQFGGRDRGSTEKNQSGRRRGGGHRRKIRCLYVIVLLVGSLFSGVIVGDAAAANTAGNEGVVYVKKGTNNLRAVDTAGNTVSYDTASHDIAAIGPRADIDSDGSREVPYINKNGKLYIVGDSDSSPTKLGDYSGNVDPRTNFGRLAIGDWDSDGNFDVLFAPSSTTDTIYRIDWDERSNAPEALSAGLGGDTANAIIASTDITGDDIREVIILDSSSDLHYVNSETSDQLVAGGTTFWGTNFNYGFGEPADLDNSGGDNPQASDYSFPTLSGTPEVQVADPDESQPNTQDESGSTNPVKSTAASADYSGDGVPDHIHIDDNKQIRFSTVSGSPDEQTEGYVTADGSKIDVDPNVGLASRVSTFETRNELTTTGANAGIGLSGATTRDTDTDGTVDEIDVTFTGDVDDATVEAGGFSVTDGGSVDSFDTGSTADDDAGTLVVSGFSADDTSVTPDVTLKQDSIDDTSGNTGPSTDSTVTASDGAAPIQTGIAYRDTDSDGTVDRVDIDYTEDVSSSTPESGDYTVGGTDSGSVSTDGTATASGSAVKLEVTGPADDTAIDITLDYAQSAGTADSITDGTNPAGSFSGVAVSDSAPAVIVGAAADSATADSLDLSFSEGVYTNTGQSGNLGSGDVSFTDDSGGGVGVDSVSHTAGESTATATLSGDAEPGSDSIAANANEIYDAEDNAVGTTATTVLDETDPSFTSGPAAGNPGPEGFDIDLTANEDGTGYYVVVSDGASAPSTTQVINGENANGDAAQDSGNSALTADTAATLVPSGLSEGTAYDAYVVIEDNSGNTLLSSGLDETTTNVAPTYSAGTSNAASTAEGTTGTVLDVDADDDSGTDYDTDVTYSLSGTDDGPFSIDSASGKLSLDSAQDFEGPTDSDGDGSYELTVTATDDAGNTKDQSVSVSIDDADETPAFSSGTSATVAESDAAGTAVQDVTADVGGSDDEGVDYALTGGNDDVAGDSEGAFAIDTTTGQITVNDVDDIDASQQSSFSLTVEASEGSASATQTVDVSVTDDVEPAYTSGPTTNDVGTDGFNISLTASEDGTAYYVVVAEGAAAPSTSQVKTGENGDGDAAVDSGTESVSAATEKRFAATELDDGTEYDVYVVAEDANGNANLAAKLDQQTDSSGDSTAPRVSQFNLTSTDTSVTLTVESDEELESLTASLDGPDATTLSRDNFTEERPVSTPTRRRTTSPPAGSTPRR